MKNLPTLILLIVCALPLAGLANDAVIERQVKTITIKEDGTFEGVAESLVRLETKQGALGSGQVPIPYFEGRQTLKVLEAYTIRPDGSRLPVATDKIFTQAATVALNAPVFNDIKYRIIVFPEPQAGGKIYFKISIQEHVPQFPGNFSLLEQVTPALATEHTSFEFSAPASMKLKGVARGMEGGKISVAGDDGKIDRWKWTHAQRNAIPLEPFQLTGIETIPYVAVTSFADWASVAKAYRSRSADKAKVTPEIKQLADEITKGLESTQDQVRALAHWTSRNLRYVGIFLNLGGYVPRESKEILETKYGDCKDHTVLLEALLKAKGIASEPALVNLNPAFELPAVASPAAFNHVITYVPALDQYIDSTAAFNRMGTLPQEVGGKPVLLVESGAIAGTPAHKADKERVSARVVLNIRPNGDVNGKSFIKSEGNFEAYLRQRISQISAGQRDAAMSAMLGEGQRGSGTYMNTDPFDLDKQFTFSTSFNLPGAVDLQSPGAFRFPAGISLTGIHTALLPERPGAPARRTPFLCGSDTREEEYEVTLPPEIKIAALPKDVVHESETISFQARYKLDGRVITVTRKLVRNRPDKFCDPAMWQETELAAAAIARDAKAQVILQ